MKRLWKNAQVLSLEKDDPVFSWMMTEDESILALGTDADAYDEADCEAVYDLQGKCLMPAFIDAHSHFISTAFSFLQLDLSACTSFAEIKTCIAAYLSERRLPEGSWLTATGYDHNRLSERAHPRKEWLDSISQSHPIVLHHQSGHVGVFNSPALKYLGIDADSQSPSGGLIEKDAQGPTGYMEENAFILYAQKVPMPEPAEILKAMEKAQRYYLSYGITTIQEGMTVAALAPLYQMMAHSLELYADFACYVACEDWETVARAFPRSIKRYEGHIKLAGLKLFLDGSPQGRTAWLREPYEGGDDCGYGTMSDERLDQALNLAWEKQLQPLVHCNGDAAVEQYLSALRRMEQAGKPLAELRPVIIHAQLLGRDQLAEVARLGLIPSFFIAHIYHWGEIHLANLGEGRARYISPAGSALARGIPFTLHQDSPVIPPDMIETLWTAVNRRTREGMLLGESERISTADALRALCRNAAYQCFEEEQKGSLAPGKLADFVILSENPLELAETDLRRLKICQTVKGARIVFDAQQ